MNFYYPDCVTLVSVDSWSSVSPVVLLALFSAFVTVVSILSDTVVVVGESGVNFIINFYVPDHRSRRELTDRGH